MNREELLDGVAESPNDDGPRLVYADWLLQRDDELDRARGEYISLACSTTRSAKRTARLKELLDTYETRWLGPVAALLDDGRRSWSRGFLEACTLHRKAWTPIGDALGHETWRTLRTLEMYGSPQPLDVQLMLLRQPELANLRALYTYQTCLEPLTNAPSSLRISELAVAPAGPPLGQLITVLRAECFGELRRLHVFGCSPELGCALMRPNLTLIAVAAPNTIAGWIAQLTVQQATFDEVRLVSSVFPLLARDGVELVLRPVDGRWSSLEIRWGDGNEPRLRDSVIDALGALPADVISHVTFVGPTTAQFDVQRWKQRIRTALAIRQTGLEIG